MDAIVIAQWHSDVLQTGWPSIKEMSLAVGTTRVSRKPWAAKSCLS
jgi:hypothetical protein